MHGVGYIPSSIAFVIMIMNTNTMQGDGKFLNKKLVNDERKRMKKEAENKKKFGAVGNCHKSKNGPEAGICHSWRDTQACPRVGCKFKHAFTEVFQAPEIILLAPQEDPMLGVPQIAVCGALAPVEDEAAGNGYREPQNENEVQPPEGAGIDIEQEDALVECENEALDAGMEEIHLPSARTEGSSFSMETSLRACALVAGFSYILRGTGNNPIGWFGGFVRTGMRFAFPMLVGTTAFVPVSPLVKSMINHYCSVDNARVLRTGLSTGVRNFCGPIYDFVRDFYQQGNYLPQITNFANHAHGHLRQGLNHPLLRDFLRRAFDFSVNTIVESVSEFEPLDHIPTVVNVACCLFLGRISLVTPQNIAKIALLSGLVVVGRAIDNFPFSQATIAGDEVAPLEVRGDTNTWSYKNGMRHSYRARVSSKLASRLVTEFFTSNATLIGTANRIGYQANQLANEYLKDDGESLNSIDVLETVKYTIHQLNTIQSSLKGDTGVVNRPCVTPFG